MLSDEDRFVIKTKAHDALMAGNKSTLFDRIEDAAYALGAERARVVKPLVWEDSEECSICRPHGYQAYDDGVATIAEAKTLIERDHIAHVLSMLEPV